MARSFAKDGVVDYGPIGSAKGRKAIRKLFAETHLPPIFTFLAHMAHNPVIE